MGRSSPAADRIIACAREHPMWTRRMIADHLQVNDRYVSRVLRDHAIVRQKTPAPLPTSSPSPQPALATAADGVGTPDPNYMTAFLNRKIGNSAQHAAARKVPSDMLAQIEARVAAGQVTRIEQVVRCTPEWPQRLNTRTSA